ncbi:MAG: hypothetical protein HRT41_05020 [Campylobacteraceae bacterium]|nr:hypothetical protein [Campylobacteraceae bacterium]
MGIVEKYNLGDSKGILVKSLECDWKSYDTIELVNEKEDELYVNENGKLTHVSTKGRGYSILWLFLKKYRKHPELLPRNLKHDYPSKRSSAEIYESMKFMVKPPMKNFKEFKERLLLATKELSEIKKRKYITRYGEMLVFINKKEDCGSGINIYGELIPILKEENETYWERAVLFDKEKKIFEYWIFPERTNDTPDKSNWELHIKFYEEQYLYEYLLNSEIDAVM